MEVGEASSQPPALAPGAILGRYVVLRRLGGPVYAVHDRQLDRKVALRLLGDDGELREFREAAVLSHPNLVAVHDAGSHRGRAFVATEFVEGTTLRAWIERRKPRGAAIAVAFEMVARGLAAAHAAGLHVGRDLLGAAMREPNGRVRVGDLRRADGPADVDEDQRRLGIALEAALGPGAPAWLRHLAARAQAVGFVDLADVADALARGPDRGRRPWVAGAVVVGVFAVSLALLSRVGVAVDPVCDGGELELEGVWDPALRARMERAFADTGLSFASHASEQVVGILDAYAADWVQMREDACEATHVRHEQSMRVLALRMDCLSRRLDELGALTGVLADADPTVVGRAARAAQALESVHTCADVGLLVAEAGLSTAPALKEEVHAVRAQLGRAKALGDAGKYATAVDVAAGLVKRAAQLDHAPIFAEALRQHGVAQAAAGEPDLALASLRRAVHVAWDGHHDRLAARIWLDLAHVAGEELSRDAEAERYLRFAEAAVDRVGGDESLRADLGFARATVLNGQGHYEAALHEYEQVLLLQREIGGDEAIAGIHNNMALALHALGRHDEALANYEQAREIWTRTLGPEHPDMATLHSNVGASYYAQGQLERARERMWRGYEIRVEALGPAHQRVADSLNNVGVVELQLGRYEEAEAHQRESLRIRELAVGKEHPDLAPTLLTLARIAHMRGDVETAREHWRRALRLVEAGHGLDHPDVAAVSRPIANMLESEGEFEEALEHRRRALAIDENTYGPGHPKVAHALRFVAEDLLALDRSAQAAAAARRALQLLEGQEAAEDRDHALARIRSVLERATAADPQR